MLSVFIESLAGKKISFCRGCWGCLKTHRCVIHDDADTIVQKMKDADVLVFATPIYYYEMSGHIFAGGTTDDGTIKDHPELLEAIFHAGTGDLFVIRTAGNTIGNKKNPYDALFYRHIFIKNLVK